MPSSSAPHTSFTETIVEMPRLCGLSDGVFAFALTLLVLDVRLPESLLQSSLPATLTGLLPRLLVYMFSFIVIGGAWGSHQRMLGQILRGDGPLVWLNLFLLFSITLLPACSVLLGRFPDLLISILVFAFDVILIQLTGFLLWRHARAHNLVNEALDPRVVLGIGRRLSISALLFAASLPLFLLSPAAVFVAWVAIALLLFTSDWLSWHQAGRTKTWSVPLSGQSAASIHLKHGAGMLQVTSQPGDQLLEGTFGGGVEASTSTADTTLEAYLQIPQKRGFMSFRYPWAWGPANSLDWLIHLNPKVPLALAVDSAGGQAALDLGGMTILDLHVRASASSLRILLPPAVGEMTLLIEASLSSCSIVVPADVPARIHSTRSLSNAEIDTARFPSVRHNHEYSSPEFAGAANRIDIALDVGWGSVEVSTGTVEGHAA